MGAEKKTIFNLIMTTFHPQDYERFYMIPEHIKDESENLPSGIYASILRYQPTHPVDIEDDYDCDETDELLDDDVEIDWINGDIPF